MNETFQNLTTEEAICVAFGQILATVAAITGLESRWTGDVLLVDEYSAGGIASYRAKFGWDARLRVHNEFVGAPVLVGSLLHEAFHSVSTEVTRSVFSINPGYEEGVVEHCTIEFARDVLGREFGDAVVSTRSEFLAYRRALEHCRAVTGLGLREFYTGLLATPLQARMAKVVEWTMDANPGVSRPILLARVASAFRVLER